VGQAAPAQGSNVTLAPRTRAGSYPSRRQSSPAFALVVDALRYRGDPG